MEIETIAYTLLAVSFIGAVKLFVTFVESCK